MDMDPLRIVHKCIFGGTSSHFALTMNAQIIDQKEIDDIEDLKDALFVFFRLPGIARLSEDEQIHSGYRLS